MDRSTMIPLLIVVYLGVSLGLEISESSEEIHSKNGKTHEDMIEAYGLPKWSVPVFGNNPVIERRVYSNVKSATRRRFTEPKDDARQGEASIQAYGSSKRVLEDNGHIERVSVDSVTGLDGRVDKVDITPIETGIRAYGLPKRHLVTNGFIERFPDNSGLEASTKDIESPVVAKIETMEDEKIARRRRSIHAYGLPKKFFDSNGHIERIVADADENSPNTTSPSIRTPKRHVRSIPAPSSSSSKNDLEAQEAKIFRPLFVYRQQLADRYRVTAKKKPIPGSYQHGSSRSKYV